MNNNNNNIIKGWLSAQDCSMPFAGIISLKQLTWMKYYPYTTGKETKAWGT